MGWVLCGVLGVGYCGGVGCFGGGGVCIYDFSWL